MKKLIFTSIIFLSCQHGESDLITHYAEKHKIPIPLAYGLVKVESNFNTKAVSNKNAKGLTQVLFYWHKRRCNLKHENDLFNPHINLNCGFSYLRKLYERDYSISNALARYNAGWHGEKTKAGQRYAIKVLSEAKKYEKT